MFGVSIQRAMPFDVQISKVKELKAQLNQDVVSAIAANSVAIAQLREKEADLSMYLGQIASI